MRVIHTHATILAAASICFLVAGFSPVSNCFHNFLTVSEFTSTSLGYTSNSYYSNGPYQGHRSYTVPDSQLRKGAKGENVAASTWAGDRRNSATRKRYPGSKIGIMELGDSRGRSNRYPPRDDRYSSYRVNWDMDNDVPRNYVDDNRNQYRRQGDYRDDYDNYRDRSFTDEYEYYHPRTYREGPYRSNQNDYREKPYNSYDNYDRQSRSLSLDYRANPSAGIMPQGRSQRDRYGRNDRQMRYNRNDREDRYSSYRVDWDDDTSNYIDYGNYRDNFYDTRNYNTGNYREGPYQSNQNGYRERYYDSYDNYDRRGTSLPVSRRRRSPDTRILSQERPQRERYSRNDQQNRYRSDQANWDDNRANFRDYGNYRGSSRDTRNYNTGNYREGPYQSYQDDYRKESYNNYDNYDRRVSSQPVSRRGTSPDAGIMSQERSQRERDDRNDPRNGYISDQVGTANRDDDRTYRNSSYNNGNYRDNPNRGDYENVKIDPYSGNSNNGNYRDSSNNNGNNRDGSYNNGNNRDSSYNNGNNRDSSNNNRNYRDSSNRGDYENVRIDPYNGNSNGGSYDRNYSRNAAQRIG